MTSNKDHCIISSELNQEFKYAKNGMGLSNPISSPSIASDFNRIQMVKSIVAQVQSCLFPRMIINCRDVIEPPGDPPDPRHTDGQPQTADRGERRG